MNKRCRDILFAFIIFGLLFTNIPKILQCNFLFGTMATKLSVYPIFIGMMGTIYYKKFNTNQNIRNDRFELYGVKYIASYLLICTISLIIGLMNYPYYDLILNGPVTQIKKLNILYFLIQQINGNISLRELLSYWMLIRPIKGLIIETIMTFGTVLLIFQWYKNDKKKMMQILIKGIYVSVGCILLYNILDCGYLLNNIQATALLQKINPIVHEIKNNGTWWPPLLISGQLRSLFAEPSYYGIYASFALPWLWYSTFYYSKKKVLTYGTIFLFSFCLYLTKARTAVILLNGEIVFLILFTFFFRKIMWRHTITILFCTIISFFLATSFINYVSMMDSRANVTVNSYLNDNVGSLAYADKRSNRARYSVMEANLRMGLTHPFFGVGYSLRQAYTKDYLSTAGLNNNEIKGWLKNQENLGILKVGFPPLGDYLVRLAETGFFGLSFFLLLPGYLFYLLLQIIFKEKNNELGVLPYIFFSISLIGIMASGIGDTLNVTYCYWFLLGVGYVLCFRGSDGNKSSK